MSRKTIVLFLVFLNFSFLQVEAKLYPVKSVQEYFSSEQYARLGDTISWEAGTFQDVIWVIGKDGINIKSERPRATIFSGISKVKIKASGITFSGFQFIGGNTDENVLMVSGSNNVIEQLNFSGYHSNYYLNLTTTAQHNTIRYCNFERKPEDKQTSVMQIQVDEKQPGYNLVSHCSFKNHTAPPNAGGDYGIEALRIGYSYQAKFISRTIVEYCYFYRCNGDGEVISSKARENIYRYNTFDDNGESHFTLRHGSDNVVYGNFFLKGAGLRIKEGQNQMVYNNYFETGDYWTIKLENYKVDPLNNIVIAHNTFAKSGSMKLGGKGDFQPSRKANPVKPHATVQNTGPDNLRKNIGLAQRIIENVRKVTIVKAERLMKEKPVTVSDSSCKRSAGGKNDFYSEGDYWWPDPANPTGPFIQKDGQTNPGSLLMPECCSTTPKTLLKTSIFQKNLKTANWWMSYKNGLQNMLLNGKTFGYHPEVNNQSLNASGFNVRKGNFGECSGC